MLFHSFPVFTHKKKLVKRVIWFMFVHCDNLIFVCSSDTEIQVFPLHLSNSHCIECSQPHFSATFRGSIIKGTPEIEIAMHAAF